MREALTSDVASKRKTLESDKNGAKFLNKRTDILRGLEVQASQLYERRVSQLDERRSFNCLDLKEKQI
jgi:hypothetical protein